MDTPEIDKDTNSSKEADKANYIPGKPYSKLRRELSEDDLSNPAVQKLLINEIDKLEIRVSDLELVEKKFYEADKSKAVLEEKIRTHNAMDVLYSFCLSIGSGLMGMASLYKINEYGWILLIAGLILIIGGIFSKRVKWN